MFFPLGHLTEFPWIQMVGKTPSSSLSSSHTARDHSGLPVATAALVILGILLYKHKHLNYVINKFILQITTHVNRHRGLWEALDKFSWELLSIFLTLHWNFAKIGTPPPQSNVTPYWI